MEQYIPQDWPFDKMQLADKEDKTGAVTVILLGNNCTKRRIKLFKGLKNGVLVARKSKRVRQNGNNGRFKWRMYST